MSKNIIQKDKALVATKKLSKADKYFNHHYIDKIMNSVDNIRDLFYLQWHFDTGVRVSDIVGQVPSKGKERLPGQEIHNIDWDNNRIYTYDHKKNKWRYIYFSSKTRSILKMWLKEMQNQNIKGRYLFPYSEKTCNRIIKKWAEIVEHPKASHVGSHWCRHTYIRLSRAAGRDIKAVQQNTGDTIKTLLEWYSDLSSEDINKEIKEKPIF